MKDDLKTMDKTIGELEEVGKLQFLVRGRTHPLAILPGKTPLINKIILGFVEKDNFPVVSFSLASGIHAFFLFFFA